MPRRRDSMAPKLDHVLGSLSPVSLLTIMRTKSMLAWYSLSTSSSSLTVSLSGKKASSELSNSRNIAIEESIRVTTRPTESTIFGCPMLISVALSNGLLISSLHCQRILLTVDRGIRNAFQFSARNRPISSHLLGLYPEEEARCPGPPDNFEERPAQRDDQGSR